MTGDRPAALTVADVDRLEPAACVAILAPLFEGAPRFLHRLAAARPFGDEATLFARARSIAHQLAEADQLELIDAHPRLGAPPGSVSPSSFREQGYDRESADAAAEAERSRVDADLAELNDAYEARFGFRYCVFVAGRSRAALVPGFVDALEADRDAELRRALDAVVDIAEARWRSGGAPTAGRAPTVRR